MQAKSRRHHPAMAQLQPLIQLFGVLQFLLSLPGNLVRSLNAFISFFDAIIVLLNNIFMIIEA